MTDTHEDHDAEIVPLHPRGDDVPEVLPAVREKQPVQGVVYQDITRVPGERLPVIPPQWRGRANIKASLQLKGGEQWHKTKWHGLRAPLYLLSALLWAVLGLFAVIILQIRWWWLLEAHSLRADAIAEGNERAWRALHKEAKETRRFRGYVLLAEVTGLAAAAGAAVKLAPWWAWAIAAAVALPLLARLGRPDGRPIIGTAIIPPDYSPPTHEIISRALGSLGIGEINKLLARAAKDGSPGIRFVSDVMRDGPGWSCHLDLPHGVTVTDILAKREELASGLRRPLSATWPEGVPEEHPGRLALWVGFHDISKTRPPKWPLAKAGTADVFGTLPFGTDPRGRPVGAPMFEVNWLIGASPGQGKALALDTPVPTPAGWTTMGELQDGDAVYGASGQPCTVSRAWPVRYGRPCYEVEFSDGTVIVADAEHQWLVDTRASRLSAASLAQPKRRESQFSRDQRHKLMLPKVVTTADMLSTARVEGGRANYSVRVAKPLAGTQPDLPIDPYALGAWLGDGTSSGNGFTSADPEILDCLRLAGITVTYAGTPERPYGYRLGDTVKSRMADGRMGMVNTFAAALRGLGVLGNKHIPVIYLRASEGQRRALLAGLLDTDGYCQGATRAGRAAGTVYFAVTSEGLARDTRHLISTLGYKSSLNVKPARLNGRDIGYQWVVTFTPAEKVFRMQRKLERQVTTPRASSEHRYVTAIRAVPSVPVRCITVSSPDSLYLVGETCIPTHNTAAVRCLALGAALDPVTDLWTHELAGKGDLEPLAQVCHRYVSGLDDDSIAYAADSARILRAELGRRSKLFGSLPKELKPKDAKVSRELAARFRELRPLVAIFDEAQNLFMHPEHGKEAADDLAYVIRLGRALGIVVVLATQRPDKDSLPTAIRGIVTARFCLKVPDYDSNDMILGTGAYKAGYNAAVFRAKTDAGLGWLKGEGDPQIIRTYYLDMPAAEKVAARARAVRDRAGVLSGYALGLEDESEARDVLADVLSVFGDAPGLHWDELADRLANRWPDRWADVTGESVSAQCRALGVTSVGVKMAGVTLKGCRRVTVEREAAR